VANQFLSYWGLRMVFEVTGVRDISFNLDEDLMQLEEKEIVQKVRKI
jgi:hypothetical protein